MTNPPTPEELGDWKFLHAPSEGAIICSGCEHSWPCPTRRLIDAYEALRGELAAAQSLLRELAHLEEAAHND